jgi:hypothetical protein
MHTCTHTNRIMSLERDLEVARKTKTDEREIFRLVMRAEKAEARVRSLEMELIRSAKGFGMGVLLGRRPPSPWLTIPPSPRLTEQESNLPSFGYS